MFQKVKQRIGNAIDGKSKTPRKSGLLIKIIFLGHEKSGKSSLLKQYNQQAFDDAYTPTIGADFIAKDVKVDDRYISVAQFWDTAGQERFQSQGTSFYRSADCCVFVFDVGSEASFNKLNELKNFFWSVCEEPKVHMIVIGNKTDLPNRKISREQAESWCKANGNIQYLECSAKDLKMTEKAFKEIIRITMDDSAPFQTRPTSLPPAASQTPITASETTLVHKEESPSPPQQPAEQPKEIKSQIAEEKQPQLVQSPQAETPLREHQAETGEPSPPLTNPPPAGGAPEGQSYSVWITVGAAVVSIAAFALYKSLSR